MKRKRVSDPKKSMSYMVEMYFAAQRRMQIIEALRMLRTALNALERLGVS